MEVGSADISIDLGAQPLADSDGAEVMMDVARNDGLAAGHEFAHLLGPQPLVLRHFGHLLRDDTFTCSFELSHCPSSISSVKARRPKAGEPGSSQAFDRQAMLLAQGPD